MINYLKYFFNLSHLFSLRPAAMENRALIILAVIFVILLALGAAAQIMAPKIKDGLKVKGIRRFIHAFFTVGILGLVYLFFAWQGVALLAARFWLLILFLVLIVWLAYILKYLLLDVPRRRKEIEKKRKFEQYLP